MVSFSSACAVATSADLARQGGREQVLACEANTEEQSNALRFHPAPAHFPILEKDDVHLWLADLRVAPQQQQALAATLAVDEQYRAARFSRASDRDAFVARRGLLRMLLAGYQGGSPAALAFTTNSHGRPQLAGAGRDPDMAFSVSRSAHLALFAFARGADLGVDIEQARDGFDIDAIAEHFFAAEEAAALRGLAPAERRHAFFRLWVHKEAYVKALGMGLAQPLDGFAISADTGARVLRFPDGSRPPRDWHVVPVTVHDPFQAALAMRPLIRRITAWHIPWDRHVLVPLSVPRWSK